ncbi:2-hydroxyacid dehydrogenase [Williamwhitmania taraxaci]|uniref:Glyoxylate/hydroxypyruvate reductase B n=1 Tax=Williamwhitmania taraxaci TaxID=1640674 RepID=A0A1G6GTT4_9BACT|nr:D-glycerate dehydrogenase [Williamwhitmania taraxaci]SDB85379.1 glyoxylate reductase [Williamwhitmania taraxaci]
MIDRANKRVLISRIFPEVGVERLQSAGFTVTAWDQDRPMTQDELIEQAKQHDALFCTLSDKIDAKFLGECSHLDIISQFAVGYDNIDIVEATRLGIPVGFTPDAMSNATADIAFGLMIATSRKMFFMHKQILSGSWTSFKPNANLGMELTGKTLGIYGLGRIGMEMAKRCKGAYNMKVIYHNRTRNEAAEKQLDAAYVAFAELLAQSDVLSIHCALTADTREIFNKAAFAQMKPTSIFINTSRGLVHNEPDLIEALNAGTIWGAGLDVTNPEPMQPDNPLLQMENVSVLPHIGSATMEARGKMAQMAAENIIEFYRSKHVPHIVNPEVLKNK